MRPKISSNATAEQSRGRRCNTFTKSTRVGGPRLGLVRNNTGKGIAWLSTAVHRKADEDTLEHDPRRDPDRLMV